MKYRNLKYGTSIERQVSLLSHGFIRWSDVRTWTNFPVSLSHTTPIEVSMIRSCLFFANRSDHRLQIVNLRYHRFIDLPGPLNGIGDIVHKIV